MFATITENYAKGWNEMVNCECRDMYLDLTQKYYRLQSDKRNLLNDKTIIEARLKIIDEEMIDINDILCKHGNHIYEHFEKAERRENES